MKIKKLPLIILASISLFNIKNLLNAKKPDSPDSTKPQTQQAQASSPQNFNIEQYVGIHATPSQFATNNLKNFISTILAKNAPNRSETEEKSFRIILNKSLGKYIKNVYNKLDYSEYISRNCNDLTILLNTIKDLSLGKESISYATTIIKLFNDRIKEAEIVDDLMVIKLLKDLPGVISHYFDDTPQTDMLDIFKKSLQQELFQISKHRDSNSLINSIAEDTTNIICNMLEQQEERIRFQQLIIRFLEMTLNKVIWSRTRYESFLPSLVQIGNEILMLAKNKIIDHADDYDSLIKSLTIRACFYIDLCGWAFPPEFLEEVNSHVLNGEIPFLEEEEQDKYIKTKKELFMETLAKCKTKSFAYHRGGIIPEALV